MLGLKPQSDCVVWKVLSKTCAAIFELSEEGRLKILCVPIDILLGVEISVMVWFAGLISCVFTPFF